MFSYTGIVVFTSSILVVIELTIELVVTSYVDVIVVTIAEMATATLVADVIRRRHTSNKRKALNNIDAFGK